MNTITYDMVQLERQLSVAEALTWVGTPFHHMAKVKKVGVDCIQLLAAAFEHAGAVTPPPRAHYPANWFLHSDRELLLEALAPDFVAFDGDPLPGDVALFKFGRCISHAAIVVSTAPLRIIHSHRSTGVLLDQLTEHAPLWPRRAGYMRLKRWADVEQAASLVPSA